MAPPDSILLCTDYLPPGGGGVEVVVDTLSRRLSDSDLSIAIFTLEAEEIDLRGHDDIVVYESPAVDLTKYIGLQSRVSLPALSAFGEAVREFGPDVIHAHNRFYFTSLMAALWKAYSRSDTPLVTTQHLGPVDRIQGVSGSAARLYERVAGRLLFRYSDVNITVSRAVANHVEQLGAENCVVIPNGVDIQVFHPGCQDTTGFTILFVGRFVRNKGPLQFLEGVIPVIREEPDVRVRMIGSGPLEGDVERRIEKADLVASIDMPGYVDSMAEEMRAANLFCRPSLTEGMPLTLLEAMASRLPVVVSPVAGVPEVVTDGETGFLVDPGDSRALSETILRLVRNENLRREIGTAARREVISEYNMERRTDEIIKVYGVAMANSRHD